MMNNLSTKSIKSAIILSVASLMGMQASEAVSVYCPDAGALHVSQQPNGDWKYHGASIGGDFDFSVEQPAPRFMLRIPHQGMASFASPHGRPQLVCSYNDNAGGLLMLTAYLGEEEHCVLGHQLNEFVCR